MARFPHTIFFVNSNLDSWRDVREHPERFDRAAIAKRLVRGNDVWTVSTYLELHKAGWDVQLVDEFVPGEICVSHYDDISTSDPNILTSFVIAIRADRDRTFICDLEVVQSPAKVDWSGSHYIPHWPQPALLTRNKSRGSRVKTAAYFGTRRNLAADLRTDEFRDQLASLGVTLLMKENDWCDYTDVDIVLAVRDGRQQFLDGKPASKLFNAWLSNCVAILGNEAAYRHHGQPGVDYLEANSREAVSRSVERLVNDPAYFEDLIRNGAAQSPHVDSIATSAKWQEFFLNRVLGDYRSWLTNRRGAASQFLASIEFRAALLRRILRGRRYVRGYTIDGEYRYRPNVLRRTWWKIENLMLD